MNKQELVDAVLRLTSTRSMKMADEFHLLVSSGEGYSSIGDMYGHAEDCFDAGMDIGEASAIKQVVVLLEAELPRDM